MGRNVVGHRHLAHPPAEQSNVLNAVTCASASDCWAVGYYYAAIAYQTLIERWNGTSWAIVPSPNSGTADNYLTDVTCMSTSDCWAVGRFLVSGNNSQTLIERWNGISWTIVTSPNTSSDQTNALTGVTCASASDCWAVGAYGNNIGDGFAQTLVERWNGISWAIIGSPNTSSTQHNVLYAVTCASASNCWSAGFHDTGQFFGTIYQPGPDQTLIERWDGSSWTIVNSPNINGIAMQDNVFYGVTCASASDCWAVGYYHNGSNGQILIERWDGTSWALAPLPSLTQTGELADVTCTSASDCWAVGDSYNGTNVQTLIERWDGTSWSIFTSPNISGPNNNRLGGVTCVSASDCWTVGLYTAADGLHPSHTLAGHYTAPLPFALVTAVSTKMHGGLGPFNIDLPPTGTRGIECRSGGANGDYSIVFTFTNPLMSVVSASTNCGSVSSNMTDGSDAHQYIVNLTGVTGACNAQYIMITLTGVLDSQGNTLASATATMGVLLGDTNGDGSVNSADISQTKSKSGQMVDLSNFQNDVTADGSINSADISLVKSKSGTALPP